MAEKIVDYKIATAEDEAENLEREVHKLLGAGWEPIGGVCCTAKGLHKVEYNQAMLMKQKVGMIRGLEER